jgi:phosphomannomutase / phosphoglucomutase
MTQHTIAKNNLINPEIFRAYDIRGIVDCSLTEETVFLIGKAIGTKTLLNGTNEVVIARDGRLSSPRLINQLTQGIVSTGCNVLDIGLVPTPILYFAASTLDIASAVMITGSHNPPNYNGLKIILSKQAIYGEQILELKNLIINNKFIDNTNLGQIKYINIIINYINYIVNNIKYLNKLKIVIDCGNGAASVVAIPLFESLGITCIPLYCEVDGNFPNHHPDPGDPKNLKELQQAVLDNKADLGIAFDGDGDRLGVIDNLGNIVWPDRYLMLFAKDILSNNNNGVIIYDVKSTNHLHNVIKQAGGQPLMWKTGHSLIKAKMQETNALLAGEMSGHIFFKDRWFGFDDGLYTAARLLELISYANKDLNSMCNTLPQNFSTSELIIKSTEADKHIIISKLIDLIKENTATISMIDGIRLDFNDCWGVIRSSNTTPTLIARFEAISLSALENIKTIFRNYLLKIDPNLSIPF